MDSISSGPFLMSVSALALSNMQLNALWKDMKHRYYVSVVLLWEDFNKWVYIGNCSGCSYVPGK